MWRKGETLYCARAVFVGDFDHKKPEITLSSRVEGFKCKDDVKRLLAEGFPYLSNGGTILFKEQGVSYLLTVVPVSGKLPISQKLTFGRNQAYKYMIGFLSGGKFEQSLTVLTKSFSSDKGDEQVRRTKRKNLESAVKGEFQFIEPFAQWKLADDHADCFLYLVKLGTDNL